MAELYLSQKTHRTQHEEVELFLEGYHDDLHVLQLKVMSLFEQVSKFPQNQILSLKFPSNSFTCTKIIVIVP